MVIGVSRAAVVVGHFLEGATTTNIYVLAECDSTATMTVNYGTTTNYGTTAITAFTKSTGGGTYVHRIKLTNLVANAVYHYQLTGQGATPVDYTLRTLVNPGTGFRFAFVSDEQASLGSPGPLVSGPIAGAILTNAAGLPLLLLNGGDPCNSADWTSWHSDFWIPDRIALSHLAPLYPTPGNHEGWNALSQAYYQAPDSTGSNGYYSFDCGDVHFCVGNYDVDCSVGSAQYNWIAADLAAARKKWKIFMEHAPAYAYTSDGHAGDPTWLAVAQNLLQPNGVQVFFSGHDHFYQHNVINGLHQVIAGGGGGPLYTPTGTLPTTLAQAKDYCYVMGEASATTLRLTIYNSKQAVLDTFELHNSAQPPAPPQNLRIVAAR